MLKAVLFDLDGTLLDTIHDIRASTNEMLRAYHYPELSLEETRAYVGNGARNLVERALPQGAENAEECYRYFKTHFEQSENKLTRLFEGETETLIRLKEKGLKLAVITNKPHLATVRLIGQFFPEGLFSCVLGDSGDFPRKPDPTLAFYACLTMRVALKECLLVGDGETDVETARNAGIRPLSCLWGYRTEAQLRAAGAEHFVTDFSRLENFIENLREIY